MLTSALMLPAQFDLPSMAHTSYRNRAQAERSARATIDNGRLKPIADALASGDHRADQALALEYPHQQHAQHMQHDQDDDRIR